MLIQLMSWTCFSSLLLLLLLILILLAVAIAVAAFVDAFTVVAAVAADVVVLAVRRPRLAPPPTTGRHVFLFVRFL